MASATATRTLPRPGRVAIRPWAVLQGALAAVALAAALGASAWLVAAAAERPSLLSPPTLRQPHAWILGPLSGLMPGLTTDRVRLEADLTTALVVLFIAWVVAWITAPRLPVRVVAAAVGLAQAVWVLGPPQPITDAFNYIVYGRMAAIGINPYTHPPVAGPHDGAYWLGNWHVLPSPYGPLFTLLCEPLGLMSPPVAFWVWKIVAVGSALGLLALVWWMAVRLGRSPQRAIAAAGLCPVTLAIGVGGFHNETLALLGVVGAAACIVKGGRNASIAAGALVVAAAGIKPSFAVAAPLVVLGADRRWAAAAGAAGMAAVTGLVMLVAFGGALPAIGLQSRLATPLSVMSLIGVATGHGGADAAIRAAGRDALYVAVAVASGLVAWRRQWALPALGVLLLIAALSLSWVMPWYLAWSLPFAALATPRALVPIAVAGCLWLGIGGIPQMPKLMHDVGYYPTRSATGMQNHLFEHRLVR